MKFFRPTIAICFYLLDENLVKSFFHLAETFAMAISKRDASYNYYIYQRKIHIYIHQR